MTTRTNFYCQNVVGDANFSIDEWNKAYEEVKNESEEIQRLVLDAPPPCKEQCFACLAIVGERRRKTIELINGADKNDISKVAERLYAEANPKTKMNVPSFAYEEVEKSNHRRIKANSDLNLYEWCKNEKLKNP